MLHACAVISSGEITPSTQFIEDWMGSRANPDVIDKRKTFLLLTLELQLLGYPTPILIAIPID
jgi:hypothetical protein